MPDLTAVTALPRDELMCLCAEAAKAVAAESQRYSVALRAGPGAPQRLVVAVRDHQAPRDMQPLTFEIRFDDSPDPDCGLLSVVVERSWRASGRVGAHVGYREFLRQLTERLRELDPDVVLAAGASR